MHPRREEMVEDHLWRLATTVCPLASIVHDPVMCKIPSFFPKTPKASSHYDSVRSPG